FHPGATTSVTEIISTGPLRATLRSTTTDGQWQTVWHIYGGHARMTVTQAARSYWFLYEGTPGGALQTASDFLIHSDGRIESAAANWTADLPGEEWVAFADPFVGRSLFVSQETADATIDSYRAMNGEMTVFGFGRNVLTPVLTGARRFHVGFANSVEPAAVAGLVRNATRPVTLNVGPVLLQNGDTTAPTTPTGLVAVAMSSSRIDLSWLESTDDVGVAGYRIYRDGAIHATVTAESTTYS